MRTLGTLITSALVTAAILLVLAGMPAGNTVHAGLTRVGISLGWIAAPVSDASVALRLSAGTVLAADGRGIEMSPAEIERRLALLSRLADTDFTAPALNAPQRNALGTARLEASGPTLADESVIEFARMLERSVEQRSQRREHTDVAMISGAASQGGNSWRSAAADTSRPQGLLAFGIAWAVLCFAMLMLMTRRWQ